MSLSAVNRFKQGPTGPTGPSGDSTAAVLSLYAENPDAVSPPSAFGTNSIALGYGSTANAEKSLAIGDQSIARHPGSEAFASGRFGSSGDAQTGRYLLRTHTVNAGYAEAFIDGTNGTQRLVLPDDSTWFFTVTITGHRTDADDGHAGYRAEGVIYRRGSAGTTTIQGGVVKSVMAKSNDTWDINIVADVTNGALKVSVRGEAGKIVRWLALVETVEVTN